MKKKKSSKSVEEPVVSYDYSKELIPFVVINPSDIPSKHIPGSKVRLMQDAVGLESDDMAKILRIGRSTYFNVLKKKRLDPEYIDVLSSVAKLWQKGLGAFDNDLDDLQEFFRSKNINLGNIKPIQLLFTESGRRELSNAFDRIEYGLYG